MQLRESATHLGKGRNESIDALQVGPIQDLGFQGGGVRIGIISDSFNAKGEWDADVEAGDLPGPANPDGHTTPVTVLKDDDEEQPTLFTDFTAGPVRKDLLSERRLFYRFRFEVQEP